MTPSPQGQWVILKCSGAQTLRLAQSLAWASIEAWSPAETQTARKAGSRSRRPQRVPIMPTFVFARAEHLFDLLRIHEAPASPHPKFSFLRTVGELSYCPDSALAHLRVAEMKGRAPEEVRKWEVGDEVHYTGSGFEGLVGTVERTKGKSVWVRFAKLPWPVETSAYLLLPKDQQQGRKAA